MTAEEALAMGLVARWAVVVVEGVVVVVVVVMSSAPRVAPCALEAAMEVARDICTSGPVAVATLTQTLRCTTDVGP